MKVAVGDNEVSVLYEPATSGEAIATFVCAHGAGGNMNDRGMQAVARELRGRGLDVVRFNFVYSEKKSGRPDPMPLLQSCIKAVVGAVPAKRLIVGGRSMGGRAASMLAADGFAADGLLLLAYPLHPAGKPEQLRDAHLPRITMPTLCLNGTRDALCRPDLMEAVLPRLGANFQMHWLEGADHSFHVLKSSGRTDVEVMREAGETVHVWLQGM
ncbi:MAG TPA: alpha/beta family hydrolase [Gemmatimonadaceae bacterium]|nr:alpha/beta family hydrolase [Gemmatimonadaceae bacterium]